MHDLAVWYFLFFCLGIVGLLMLDLLVIGRKSHIVSFKESIIWTTCWVMLAVGFFVFLRFFAENLHGISSMEQLVKVAGKYAPTLVLPSDDFNTALDIYRKNLSMEFITGYLVEYSLSIDNIFVIMMILSAFSVPQKYYKSVLFWGILGAIIL